MKTRTMITAVTTTALVTACFWCNGAIAGPGGNPPAGNPEQAINEYRATLSKGTNSAQAQYNLGILFERTGDREQAEYYYREAIRMDPGHVMANYKLGLLLAGKGKFDQAVILINKAIELQPGLPGAYAALGNVYLSMHKTDDACREFRKALADKTNAGKLSQKTRQLCNF